jgi:hypothetical protein
MILDELTRSYPLPQPAIDAAQNFYRKIPAIPRDIDNRIDDDTLEYYSDKQLVANMQRLGWTEYHTEGYYSSVFIKPSEPYALKINKRVDRPYAWFALIAAKFPNEHFPKIGNAKIVKVGKENYRIYAIEKLKPVENQGEGRVIASFCKWSVETTDDLQYQMKHGLQMESGIPELKGQTAGLITACQILRKYSKGFFIDIHYKNIMARNNTIVITDPFTPAHEEADI